MHGVKARRDAKRASESEFEFDDIMRWTTTYHITMESKRERVKERETKERVSNRPLYLVLVDDSMVEPVCEVLGVYPEGGPVLHQPRVVDVGRLAAPHALVNPPYHVPQDGLSKERRSGRESSCVRVCLCVGGVWNIERKRDY